MFPTPGPDGLPLERRPVPFERTPLADEAHRRVYAAALLEPGSVGDLARTAGVEARKTVRVLLSLADSGLVERRRGSWHPVLDRIALVVDDRVNRPGSPIPRRRAARLEFLRRTVQAFEPGVLYPEAQVNEMLKPVNPDVAALRRYLVDEGLLERGGGLYGRPAEAGSSVD